MVSVTKLFDSTKSSKNVNMKKKAIVTALFRETQPDKITKGITDLNKVGVTVKKLSVKWDLSDSCFQAYVTNLGRNVMADYAFVLLVKIIQLSRMGACREAKILYQGIHKTTMTYASQN